MKNINEIIIEYKNKTDFLEKLSTFFIHTLNHNPIAINYCEKRNLDETTRKQFKIGLTPKFCQNTYEFVKLNNLNEEFLFNCEILKKDDNGKIYDNISDRIIFPLEDGFNRIVGFTGRIWNEIANTDVPKYINTSTSEIFIKSLILYNFFIAKPYIISNNYVIVVEGNLDVISFVKNGVYNTVAPCGTSFTEEQIKFLLHYTKNIIILFDNDEAGIKSSQKMFQIIKDFGGAPFIINLQYPQDFNDSEKLDPDKYIHLFGVTSILQTIHSLLKTP